MELTQAVTTRRSIRKYKGHEVPEELIERIIRAGMSAPSAGNQQPWHFIVVRDQAKMRSVNDFHPYAAMLSEAPVSIIICGDPDGKKWPDFWPQDCSAAAQNMLLAARDLDLGTVWVGVYPLEERMQGMRKLLEIPDNIFPFAIIPIGWPDAEFKAIDRFNGSLIHHERW